MNIIAIYSVCIHCNFHDGFNFLFYCFKKGNFGATIKMEIFVASWFQNLKEKASVTKRRGIGPIRTEISQYKIRKKLFIFQIVRFNGICIWQNYFCILPNIGDFGAKTSLFLLFNQPKTE